MTSLDLSKTLKNYKTGWVAVDKEKKVVAHAQSFSLICKKIKKDSGLLLLPASQNYFGFVTFMNG